MYMHVYMHLLMYIYVYIYKRFQCQLNNWSSTAYVLIHWNILLKVNIKFKYSVILNVFAKIRQISNWTSVSYVFKCIDE